MVFTPSIIHSDPDILGGKPVFTGTRVPIKTLLDYLEAGDSLDVFLDHFPSVSKEQAIASLELAEDYQQMIEAYEDTSLYRAMIEVKDEIPLSIEEALIELEKE